MVLVDHREGSIELLEPLRKMGLPAEKGINIPADLVWEGRGEGGTPVMVGVEYKKLGELVNALRTQRLQGHQLLKMRENFQFCYLLIEGELHYDTQGKLTQRVGRREFRQMAGSMAVNELLKRIFVLHLRGGLNTLWARTRQDTLRIVEALYYVWTDCNLDQHQSHIAIYQAPSLTPISEFRGFFSRIDGLGLRKTLAVEKYFGGSIRKAVNAPKADWLRIDGIGPELANHIEQVMQ